MQFSPDLLNQCWFLAGPTACGKSALGLELAELIDAEIVSLDSMSLYRGMDIGTDKPSPEDRLRVPHHLIDIIDPHEEFSLAEYVEAAEKACRSIVSHNRVPLFVGGTGLYLRGILRGVFDGPAADWEFRHTCEQQARDNGPDYLHGELQKVDPDSAETLHRNDSRRLIRALEVFHLTGKPLSEQQQQPPLPPEQRPQHVYWLNPSRDRLYERINSRVQRMMEQGLLDEVRTLISANQTPISRTARQALGYKEVIDFLNGDLEMDELVNLIQTRTRQFAKRQHTWFRNLQECRPIDVTGNENPAEVAQRILEIAKPSILNSQSEFKI
ncbi:MAG: tRNA (adenosine(37)-N6)-dimethylallyltransferase MiaA [Candidatus Anammoxibacter sp.]